MNARIVISAVDGGTSCRFISFYFVPTSAQEADMAIMNNVNEVLHRIRCKLYPNYLTNIKGAYIARTNNEASLSIFRDIEENAVNSVFIPGNQFCVLGHKIKVAGDDPEIGLYFVPLDAPSKAVKVERIAENSQSKIIGIAPDTGYQRNSIEIRTQFTGSKTIMLKAPRVISGNFVIETAA